MKKIITALVLLLTLTCLFSCGKKNEVETNNNPQNLQFLKSDLKLTQDQVMSQIKAEHLRENNGYKDDDEIIVLVNLNNKSMIDYYLANTQGFQTIRDFACSDTGEQLSKIIDRQQTDLINELYEKKLIKDVVYKYNTITNSVACKITYGNLKEIEQLASVSKTILSDTYNQPKSVTDTSAIINDVDVYETGIFNSSSVSYTGNGTVVAVLDSGFDCSHTVFANQPSKEVLTPQIVSSLIPGSTARTFTKNLDLSDVYYSRKIPFVYDYADKDPDVFPYDSEHGTHVAGIIGGSDDVITGVAVDTQLVLLKVFPDLSEGGKTEDILAALEDAVKLGVDAINMSLGSACGFTREEDNDHLNEVYDSIYAAGISLVTAASNDYSSAMGGEQGNTNMVTNPDSATVGSPSTYTAALSVASISGTKSKYLLCNNEQIVFFKESNAITGKENDFFKELGLTPGVEKTFEYVTIPGVGKRINFANVGDLTGKIALIRRGDNTFEEKALNAKNAGAAACIIYNNIDGDIIMSMGKSDHIPTISISKDDGTILASKDKGTITIRYENQAGPFMSDFSSWGPSPNLELKPEITAHGGNIKSSIPGGEYDEQSGTSMATPNMCGVIVLIKQYLKEKFPEYSAAEITRLTNQLLMSTASIVLNQEGNPYSPRKQGAGLGSLKNSVNSKAILTVDGIDRTKLELKDDPNRLGVYTMKFNIENLSNETLAYDLSLLAMTESVSTSDDKHVAEKAHMLNSNYENLKVSGGTLNGKTITVDPYAKCVVELTYKLTSDEKQYINDRFPYGMFVEGFVCLKNNDVYGIDLNIPFLAFFGDWTEAPMFDKTYYEVESEAHNNAINYEDKIKADYFATTPYGSYFYNYIIPLGTYLYDIDESIYDAIPGSLDHIAISNILGTIDGISTVYAGLLRNAKSMYYTITDKLTGEVIYTQTDYNCQKAHYNGIVYPYLEDIRFKSARYNLINNREYEFKMEARLDYGQDGGASTNVRNSFAFDFTLDDEAPTLKSVTYDKVYDKQLKKDRYYINMVIYDNQYVQSISPIIFTSSSSYALLSDKPIPVYSEKGTDNTVRFEITDYLEAIKHDGLITSALAFSIDDYALNSNIYLCQLPGTKGEFKFTKDGTMDGADLVILSMYEDEVVDITKYLATKDSSVDANKDYLKYLQWTSSNTEIAEVQGGLVKCKAPGTVTITVKEQMDLNQAVLIVNVKERANVRNKVNKEDTIVDTVENSQLREIKFSYFETLFAYSRAAQTSEIGETGDKTFITSTKGEVSFYPGESIKLYYDVNPWYAAEKYKFTFSSTNPSVAKVEEDGTVTALKKGVTNIILTVEGSTIITKLKVTVKSEFVIENRMLIAYKGLGGDVVIPDDEGILYIGAYAFCLYDTDRTMELPEDDFDANKIPQMNTSITSITIPYGVEEIQKFAFYNCSGLRTVNLPETCKIIREYAFHKDVKLETINLDKITVIGASAFEGCVNLKDFNAPKIYALGRSAFEGCTSLTKVDLTTLRNNGARTFRGCTNLETVILGEHTKLSEQMFYGSGVKEIDIYETVGIPASCFSHCEKLQRVSIHNDLVNIYDNAFASCTSLTEINFLANVDYIGYGAFANCEALTELILPNCSFTLGNYVFYNTKALTHVYFNDKTEIKEIQGTIFEGSGVYHFPVDHRNPYYSNDTYYLLSKDGKKILLCGKITIDEFSLDAKYEEVGNSAFSAASFKKVIFNNPNLVIGDYAFANNKALESVSFNNGFGYVIGKHAFNNNTSLLSVENGQNIKKLGDYAFANCVFKEITLGDNLEAGEGAFFQSKLVKVTIGANSKFGLGAFQNCYQLEEVVMPEAGNVHFGVACFGHDRKLSKIDLSKLDSIIEDQTFYGCANLRIANLTNVLVIGEYAFSDCSALSYVSFPVVEEIKQGAFARYEISGGAPIIESITFPDSLTKLGDGAFLGCEGLTKVDLNKVTEYGNYLFAYCKNLATVILPQSMIKIGEYSFAGCDVLTTINLGNVKEIAKYAFTSSVSLANVDLSNVETIGEGAFAQTALTGILEINKVKEIGAYAFQGTLCINVFANSVETIGDGAFQNMENVTEISLSNNLKSIGHICFLGDKKLKTISCNGVKDGVINDYITLDNGILYKTLLTGKKELVAIPAGLNISTYEILEGTTRVDIYAGNENKNLKQIVFPDSLVSIANYAFYHCDNLKIVEFKSIEAPILESEYNKNAKLEETDPGYNDLHHAFDLFGYELYYYQFVDLVGKKAPLIIVLPINEDISGYDSLVYSVYFGNVENADRSDYVAMESAMKDFIDYCDKINKLNVITLMDESLVNNCLTALGKVKQDPQTYGISEEEWTNYLSISKEAKTKIQQLKLASSNDNVKSIQEEINKLPNHFDIKNLSVFKSLASRLKELTFAERSCLDLTKYNVIVDEYNQYLELVSEDANSVKLATTKFVTTTIAYLTAIVSAFYLFIKH